MRSWMSSRDLALAAVALCTFSAAQAQPSGGVPPAATRSMAVPGMPAKQLYEIKPDGRKALVTDPKLRYTTEVLTQQESVEAILKRYQWAKDEKTLTLFKAMNPEFDPSEPLKAGDKITIISMMKDGEWPTDAQAKAYVPDSPNIAGLAFKSKTVQANRNFAVAKQMSPVAFVNTDLQQRHLRSIEDVKVASQKIESKADHLSSLDYAVALYQVDYANKLAAEVNAKAQNGKLTGDDIALSTAAARRASASGERAAAGQQVARRRLVEVNVYKAGTQQHASALAVYIFPSGFGTYDFGQQLTETYLTLFSFMNDASPVAQEVPTEFDARVCIGPKNAVARMAKLIREQRATTCRRLEFAMAGPITVTFTAPDDVAKP